MLQVVMRAGRAELEEVPRPQVEAGSVLVQNAYSCISTGTEMAGLTMGGLPLWKRAIRQPANVAKAVDAARSIGLRRTWELVQGKLAAGAPSGYSCAGKVLAVGDGVHDISIGDRVACAGAGLANHAEVVRVPRNLVVPLPDDMSLADASTVTLGAIALQGVRRASPTLGETFVVIGLGLLGQLTVQLLGANGIRTIGLDLDEDRISRARTLGLDLAVDPSEESTVDQVARLTRGIGADAVIITAASTSDEIISQAFRMTRKKGRVVLVGDVGLSLRRGDFYAKEIDFFISTSYGPGRYDRGYEEAGLDYPVSYVRWTENRNMEEYLELVRSGRVRVGALVDGVFELAEVGKAYESLRSAKRPLMALLRYPDEPSNGMATSVPLATSRARQSTSARGSKVRVALIGAGGFAQGMHLPNLARLEERVELVGVVSRNGLTAKAVARRYAASFASTDVEHALASPDVDAVLIATRHDSHADLALRAIRAGKHVFVEKPMVLRQAEFDDFARELPTAAASGLVFLTGYNRRFSSYGVRAKSLLAGRSTPMMLQYTMNAGFIPRDHWIQGAEGGGRNLGEACHIYDLMRFLVGARSHTVKASPLRPHDGAYMSTDNFVATIEFAEGSVASILYTSLGTAKVSKERLEVFHDGKILQLDDFKRLSVAGSKRSEITTRISEKGQYEEMVAFIDAIRSDRGSPIPIDEQLEVASLALAIERQLTASER